MPTSIKLTISGEAVGKQRPQATRIGKHVRVYTPKETITYENKIVNEYKKLMGNDMLFDNKAQILATIKINYQLQKVHFIKSGINQSGKDKLSGKMQPTIKPDIDNIVKSCFDALNGIAYPDDSQIVSIFAYKEYALEPSVEITLEEKRVWPKLN